MERLNATVLVSDLSSRENDGAWLIALAERHPCSRHDLFEFLQHVQLNDDQVAALLRNYDAHASVLRRLLLHAAASMPEPAVAFILENVRNEYGNGQYELNHQAQLRDLSRACGISHERFMSVAIQPAVKQFIKLATRCYRPGRDKPRHLLAPAITAGAITATELLAIKEFALLQKAFSKRGLKHHIWFQHVSIEEEHSDDSLALAMYFCNTAYGVDSVEYGLNSVLDANIKLYDGLLAAVK